MAVEKMVTAGPSGPQERVASPVGARAGAESSDAAGSCSGSSKQQPPAPLAHAYTA